MASIDASISLCSFDTKYLMRKLATLTKMTAKGLSTWTFAQCDSVYVAFGGTTNRCIVLQTKRHLEDLMSQFVSSYGYERPRPKAISLDGVNLKPIKRVPPSMQKELALLAATPSPAEEELVPLFWAIRVLASIDAFLLLCPIGFIHLSVTRMLIKVPGQDLNLRFFEKVETVDDQYNIYDIGVEQPGEDGKTIIDSICVGGSFSYAKSLVKSIDDKAAAKKADASDASSAAAA